MLRAIDYESGDVGMFPKEHFTDSAWSRPEIRQKTPIQKIDDLDLSMVKMKVCLPVDDEGHGWTVSQADQIEVLYKQFLKLQILYPDRGIHERIVPTKEIDDMWHAHILDLRKYEKDCHNVFGKLLYHYPYFGLRGEDDAQHLVTSFEETKKLFKRHFGTTLEAITAQECMCGNCGGGSYCSGKCS